MPETTSQPAVKITRRWGSQYRTQLSAAILSALRNERERAAKIADAEFGKEYPGKDYGDVDDSAAYRIAKAIREGQCNE